MLALEIKDLTKVYQPKIKDKVIALKKVNLSVTKGDFFGLLGPNGAGKTTLIGILSSLVNKTSGFVSIYGFDIETNLEQAKAHLGIVPQEFNFNIFEKVKDIILNQAGYYGLSRSLALKKTRKYLETLGLWDKRDQISSRLSGGMKRRLMIARALVHEPKILILDEPTAGVDIELRRSMWDFLRELNKKGTTIILTTHYLEEAESLCKNIAIIDQGSIIENTSTQDLVNKLSRETFIFDLLEPIQNFEEKDFPMRLVNPTSLEVDLGREQSVNSLFHFFSKKNIKVSSMRNKSNRLEELFIKLLEKGKS